MRLLIAATFALATSAFADELRLELKAPRRVALGEPYVIEVALHNPTSGWVRVAPVFNPSPEYLRLIFRDRNGSEMPSPNVVADVRSSFEREHFLLLAPKHFVGRTIRLSPALEDSPFSVTGFREGCYTLTAILRLHNFGDRFEWSDGIAVETSASTAATEVCFTAPRKATLLRQRTALASDDVEDRLEAYRYFSSVRDAAAGTLLRRRLGPPSGWRERADDELAVLHMIARQCDAAWLPYVAEAVHGRHAAVAETIRMDIVAGSCR